MTRYILHKLYIGSFALLVGGSVSCTRDAAPPDDLGWVAPVIDSTVRIATEHMKPLVASAPLSVNVRSFLQHMQRAGLDVDSARFVAAVGRPLLDGSTPRDRAGGGSERGGAADCSRLTGACVELALEWLERTRSGYTVRVAAGVRKPPDPNARYDDLLAGCANLWELRTKRDGERWVVGPARLAAMC